MREARSRRNLHNYTGVDLTNLIHSNAKPYISCIKRVHFERRKFWNEFKAMSDKRKVLSSLACILSTFAKHDGLFVILSTISLLWHTMLTLWRKASIVVR